MDRIDIRNIKVGGDIGRRIDVTIQNNICAVDIEENFIRPFEGNWDFKKQGDFIGLGKFIDALTRFAAYKQDDELTALRKQVIEKVTSLQEEDGYLGIMPPENRLNTLWDIHEMSFLILGLANDYACWKEATSLDTARKLADYLMKGWKAAPQTVPSFFAFPTLGVEEAFVALYGQTLDQRYLDFVTGFLKLKDWNTDIVIGRHGKVEGHVYNYLSITLAKLRLNQWIPDPDLADAANRAADFLMKEDGMVITGEAGNDECWMDNQEGDGALGETCATAYIVKLMDALLRHTGNPIYGDVMERVIFNGLFAAQSPDGRQIRYYTPLEGPRRYFSTDIYCCPNNYRRVISELPGMIYYTSQECIAVNLYTPSTATMKLNGGTTVTIRQETRYPREGKINILVCPSTPSDFILKLRIPKWCGAAKVWVNDKIIDENVRNGNFLEINRRWETGDRVLLDFPMAIHLIGGRKMQAGRVAIMRGPVVYCLNRSRNKELDDVNLHLVTLDTDSPEDLPEGLPDSAGIVSNDRVCRIKAWMPFSNYPMQQPGLTLTFTEFTDPDGEAVYFRVPNPYAAAIVEDELLKGTK